MKSVFKCFLFWQEVTIVASETKFSFKWKNSSIVYKLEVLGHFATCEY